MCEYFSDLDVAEIKAEPIKKFRKFLISLGEVRKLECKEVTQPAATSRTTVFPPIRTSPTSFPVRGATREEAEDFIR